MAGLSPMESVDAKKYFEMIERLFKFVEDAYLKNDDNKRRTQLAKALRNHLKLGGQIAYNVLPNQYTSQVMAALESQDMPYVAFPDARGNMMYIIKDSDSQKFLEIQKSFTQLSTDYAKELSPQAVVSLYKKHKIKDIDTLNIKDEDMLGVAEKKLYGAGITFAKLKEPDGSTTVILSPFSKFASDGNDMLNFELMHAFEQSKADPLITGKGDLIGLRFEQAKWDKTQEGAFADCIVNGEDAVFASCRGEVNCYIEATKMGVVSVKKDASAPDGWSRTPIPINRDAAKEEIQIALSKATADIMDGGCISGRAFDRDAKNQDLMGGGPYRPTGENSQALKGLEKTGNLQVKRMLIAINAEATKYVNSGFASKYMSQEQAYKAKREYIIKIMEAKELPEIQRFLNSTQAPLSREEKEEWYENIRGHFLDTNEKDNPYECTISKHSTQSYLASIRKLFTKEAETQKGTPEVERAED